MSVAVANCQFLDFSTPGFRRHGLIEKFNKGRVTACKVISERLTFLIIQCKLYFESKLIDIEVDDFRKVVGHKVEMCKRSDHSHSLSSLFLAYVELFNGMRRRWDSFHFPGGEIGCRRATSVPKQGNPATTQY